MNSLGPLVILWLLTRGKCPPTPTWPNAASPPPPPPPPPPVPPLPLRAQPPPDPFPRPTPKPYQGGGGDFGGGGADNSPSAPPSAAPPSDAGTPSWTDLLTPSKAKAQAKPRRVVHAPAVGPPPPPSVDVSVANLQTALIKRGAKVVKDGLYGPKTAAAWQAMARKHKLSPVIARRAPKIARVAAHTFSLLNAPVVP